MNTNRKIKTWIKVAFIVAIYLSLLIPIISIKKDVDKTTNTNCMIYEEHVVCIYD